MNPSWSTSPSGIFDDVPGFREKAKHRATFSHAFSEAALIWRYARFNYLYAEGSVNMASGTSFSVFYIPSYMST